ncbi:unnamed protein product, partial [Larinioides sclopetarius]
FVSWWIVSKNLLFFIQFFKEQLPIYRQVWRRNLKYQICWNFLDISIRSEQKRIFTEFSNKFDVTSWPVCKNHRNSTWVMKMNVSTLIGFGGLFFASVSAV